MTKPIIGITSGSIVLSSSNFGSNSMQMPNNWHLTTDDFIQFLLKAGASPVILPSNCDIETSKYLWDKLDGILFSGGLM